MDRWWWLAAAALIPAVSYLNIDALGMQGIYPDYICFRSAILHGLDPAANTCASSTFPMWGYGWILVITRSEVALLVLQGLAALASAWLLLHVLDRDGLLRGRPQLLVKGLLVVCIPWYAFHALRWPYSEASTLLVLSFSVLLVAVRRSGPAFPLFALSGVLYGGLLNFRSDYILLPVFVIIVIVALSAPRLLQVRRMAIWVAAMVVALIPWMIYSHRATGHVLLTSTNSGHVLYISLGQLPANPWGITPSDGDPRMHRELDAHFHRGGISSLTYSSDNYLRRRFITLVSQHPGAWLHKDLLDARHTLTGGFYNGEFIQSRSCEPTCLAKFGYTPDGSRVRSPVATLFGSGLSLSERARFALQEGSALEGRVLALLGYLLAVLLLAVGLRRRNLTLALVALVPVYQAAANTFAYYLPSYSSNVILFDLVLIGVGVAMVRRPRRA